MKLFKDFKHKKVGLLTDAGNTYCAIYGIIDVDNKEDMAYFKERGFEEFGEEPKKKTKKGVD